MKQKSPTALGVSERCHPAILPEGATPIATLPVTPIAILIAPLGVSERCHPAILPKGGDIKGAV